MAVAAGTVAPSIIYGGLWLSYEKVASKKPYLIQDQSTKTEPYFLPKWPKLIPHKAEKPTLWGRTYRYSPHRGVPPSRFF